MYTESDICISFHGFNEKSLSKKEKKLLESLAQELRTEFLFHLNNHLDQSKTTLPKQA